MKSIMITAGKRFYFLFTPCLGGVAWSAPYEIFVSWTTHQPTVSIRSRIRSWHFFYHLHTLSVWRVSRRSWFS